MAILATVLYGEGEEELALSVNLAHGQALESKDLALGEFFFDVNKYQCLYDALVLEGWIEVTGQTGTSGFVEYPVVRIAERIAERI
jgi:hypothetical protein